jgi:hypothetical protein
MLKGSTRPRQNGTSIRIETDDAGEPRDAVVSTELLDEDPPEALGTALIGVQIAEHLRAAKGREVLVTNWRVQYDED